MAKCKYNVYLITTRITHEGTDTSKEFKGQTWAESPKKAEGNMRYRCGQRKVIEVRDFLGGTEHKQMKAELA